MITTVLMYITAMWALSFVVSLDTSKASFEQRIVWKLIPAVLGIAWLFKALSNTGWI